MTRKLLAGTTAIALALSSIAPPSLMAAASEMKLAQAQGTEQAAEPGGNKDKRGKKGEKAETCQDGTEPPCAATEAAAPASENAQPGKAAREAQPAEPIDDSEAKGNKKKAKNRAKAATEAPSEAATGAGPLAEQPASAAGADVGQAQQEVTKTEEATPVPAATQESGQAAATKATSEATAPGKSAEAKSKKKKKVEEGEAAATGEAKMEAEPNLVQPPAETATSEPQPAPGAEIQAGGTSAQPKVEEPKVEEQTAPAAITEQPAPPTATTEQTAPATGTTKSNRDRKKAAKAQARAEQAPPAAAATAVATDGATQAKPVTVTTETVTEETTRTSNEEVEQATNERRKKKKHGDKDDDLLKILGAAGGGLAAGVIIGSLLRDGSEVVGNTGDRVIVERNGQYYVRKDENEILRRPGSAVQTQTFNDGSSRTVVERADGTRVVTIRDQYGYVVRRHRELPDGRQILLFDDARLGRDGRPIEQRELRRGYIDTLPQARHVDYSYADRRQLRETLMARPVAGLDRSFSLRQVRETRELRDLVPGIDLDTITFASGSAAISYDQARNIDELGRAMEDILQENPGEVFLIEGHTDAVGSALTNLALSDRRAETVALALTEYYDIPPENLITQGYGEEFLKIQTDASERPNRRATVRRITPLLDRTAQSR